MTREETEAWVEACLLGVQNDPDQFATIRDLLMERIEDEHVAGAVDALKTYAETLEETDPLAVATLHGFAKALRVSAGRIHRNYQDGKTLAALDPDGELDSGGHDS